MSKEAMARQLPRGRVFATGKALTPYTRPVLFTTLLDLARTPDGPTLVHSAGGDPALSRNTDTKASPSQSASPTCQTAARPAPRRPTHWDSLEPGDLVLGRDPAFEAWFEATIIAVDGETLRLRWRDYNEVVVTRTRDEIALLHPGKPEPRQRDV